MNAEEPPMPPPPSLAVEQPDWLTRNWLSLLSILAMPFIFCVFYFAMGGLTPDPVRDIFHIASGPKMSAPKSTDEGDARAQVEAWVKHVEEPLVLLRSLERKWAWEAWADYEAELAEWKKARDDNPSLVGPLAPQKPKPPRNDAEVIAADLAARYAYGVPTGLLILVALPVTIVVLFSLPGAPDRRWQIYAVLGVVVAIASGLLFQYSHPVRIYTAEYLLGKAALEPYRALTPETWLTTFNVVTAANIAGMAATAMLIIKFAWLASWQPRQGTALSKAEVASLSAQFKRALMLGSAVLILAVASTHGLFGWAPTLMSESTAKPIIELGSSASLYWGVIHSLTLFAVAAPAAIRLDHEIKLLAAATEDADRAQLAQDAGFSFDFRQVVTTALTLAGPILTAPFLDLIKAASQFG